MTLATFDNVSRRFGDHLALDSVNLEITPGEIVGLLGPNGAGKSTLLSLLTGQRAPSTGKVTLFGSSPQDYRNRKSLGSTPQETALPEALKVKEIIDLVGGHFEDRLSNGEVAELFGLETYLGRQAGALSGGQKRRLSVALAFVGKPQLVLLDEPTTGLDVDARRVLWDALRSRHEAGATIVVTSHYLEEIEALAERVVIVDQGRIRADDKLAAVIDLVKVHRVELRTSAPEAVRDIAHDAVVTADGDRLTVSTPSSDDFVTALVRNSIPFTGLLVRGASLEEAFLSLTRAQVESGKDAS